MAAFRGRKWEESETHLGGRGREIQGGDKRRFGGKASAGGNRGLKMRREVRGMWGELLP